MKGVRMLARALISGLVVLSAACAGEGTGLDEFGNPLTQGRCQALEATFACIQDLIFTATCTDCHAGADAPLGLSLEAGVSHDGLVNVPSVERPELMRVRPGRPDSSYLVLKVEGASGIVGGRMPLGLPPLSAGQIAAIRDWIAAGALEN